MELLAVTNSQIALIDALMVPDTSADNVSAVAYISPPMLEGAPGRLCAEFQASRGSVR